MRLLYSCPLDPVKHAAAGGHVLSAVRALHRQGHAVTLVHMGPRIAGLDGIGQVALAATGARAAGIWGRNGPLARALWRAWRTGAFDVLYHRMEASAALPPLLCRWRSIPLVVEVNSLLTTDLDAWQAAPWQRRLLVWLERLNYGAARHIVVVTQGIADALVSRYGVPAARLSVVPNGADLAVFRPLDRRDCRRGLYLPEAGPYIAFAGTFQPWQGLETIVQAAAVLRRSYPRAVYLIVGDGPERAALEARVRDSGLNGAFRLVGWQSPEETARYLGAADVCLAPYTCAAAAHLAECQQPGARIKGSPLKIYTYLAAGRPVVASHFNEAGMLVEELGVGLSFPPEQPAALAQAIAQLLDHPDEAAVMGARGRQLAEERFGWEAVARRLADLCAQAVAR